MSDRSQRAPAQEVSVNLRPRLDRVIFGSFSGKPMFSLAEVEAIYAELYGPGFDAVFAASYLSGLADIGYVVMQEDKYGVIMAPLGN